MPRRFFRHGELPLVLLALVSGRPKNGYEIMADLTRLFGPHYRASPGSIYPAIEALEARADLLAAVELRTGVRLTPGDSLEPVLARFNARVAPLSGHVDAHTVAAVLDRAAVEIENLNGKELGDDR